MTPTVLQAQGYRLFFYSREETRMHVHVSHADGEAKFWIAPDVRLASSTGFSATQLRAAEKPVIANRQEIEYAWRGHFGG